MSWEEREVLLVVKTYPVKSKAYGNTVCTAGILEDTNEWIRIYPIRMEVIEKNELRKYTRFKAEVKKNTSEKLKRKESYKIRENTIKVVDRSLVNTKNKGVWQERKKILLNLLSDSKETLVDKYNEDKTSLGIIKPKKGKVKFLIKKPIDEIEIDVEKSTQFTITGEKLIKVDKIENVFKYKFKCNNIKCKGHEMICEDWELLQAFRSWKNKYNTKNLKKILIKKFHYYMIDKRDLYFILGTYWKFPTWLIIGLFYPPKQNGQKELTDFLK